MNRWPTKPLGEICVVDWGNTELTKSAYVEGGSYLAVSAAGCDGRIGHKEHAKHTPVLSAIGAQCGRMFLPEEDFTAIKNTITLTPREGVCTGKFLYQLLTHVKLPKRGAAQPFIAKGDIQTFQVPVPPMMEQERIVKLMDEADELRKLRTQAVRRTADLIPALFDEMFGDPVSNPKGWISSKLAEVCDGKTGIKAGPFGSSLKKDSYTIEGPRIYGQEQVIAGDFSIGNYHISETKFAEMSAYAVKPDDLLISLVGTIGKVAIVPDGIERGIINPRLLRVRPRTELLHPGYLAQVITSSSVIKFFSGVATGITMGVLNAGLLKRLSVPLPPMALQKEFVQRKTEIRDLEARQATSRVRLDALFQSMLHRAFNGEL